MVTISNAANMNFKYLFNLNVSDICDLSRLMDLINLLNDKRINTKSTYIKKMVAFSYVDDIAFTEFKKYSNKANIVKEAMEHLKPNSFLLRSFFSMNSFIPLSSFSIVSNEISYISLNEIRLLMSG